MTRNGHIFYFCLICSDNQDSKDSKAKLEQQIHDKDEMITKLKSVAMKSKKEAAVLKGKVGIYPPGFISRAVQNLNLLLSALDKV